MIKTEKGKTTFEGSFSEIAADLGTIMQTALEETPVQLLIALAAVSDEINDELNAPEMVKDTVADRQKMLAAVLSQLPKEELEALKKKANRED